MQEIKDQLQRVEETLERVEGLVQVLQVRQRKNALRRRQFREAKKLREEGLLPLPPKHMIRFRDRRLAPRVPGWAAQGMRFGRADQPEQFYTWLVHQWNNCTYLKKPITCSGSTFRNWDSTHRFSYGARDLLGYVERKNAVQVLRNDGEVDDFSKRPWWDWSYSVFKPVFAAMQALGFEELPCRFRRCCRLMMGGFGSHEVYTDLCWDFQETRPNINRMLVRVGVDLQLMLRACYIGLRVKGRESPVSLPSDGSSGPASSRRPVSPPPVAAACVPGLLP